MRKLVSAILRFMVTIEGHEVGGIQDVNAFASAMDFAAIAALK